MCQRGPDAQDDRPRPKEEEVQPPRPLADEALRHVVGGMRPIAASSKRIASEDGGTPGG